MTQRRMFSPQIIDSDAFLDMPLSAQNLYFHLGMRADDDGFVGNPKKILRQIGGTDDDLKVLLGKRFILLFDAGIIVLKHWRINNYIRKDRYRETTYLDEKNLLRVKENGAYTLDPEQGLPVLDVPWKSDMERVGIPSGIPKVDERLTQVRLGKVRLGKDTDRERTPSEIAKDFFELKDEAPLQPYKDRVPEQTLRSEAQKFILYWTEPNKSGTRQRWELERTFDVHRRLATWFSRVKNYQQNTKNRTII